ncbi:MAG: hypothetical protein AAGI13_06890 [Pseudomonadota bacterium]
MPYYDTAVLIAYRLPPWSGEEEVTPPTLPRFHWPRWLFLGLPAQSKRSTA